jgi:DNA-binding CsgD family transcriptional regulator
VTVLSPAGAATECGRPGCPAVAAVAVVAEGRHRQEAIRYAEMALHDPRCVASTECVQRAMGALLCAGALLDADAHWRRLAGAVDGAGRWPLLRAQLTRLAGDTAGARAAFEQICATDEAEATRQVAVAWLIEILAALGDLGRAEKLVAGEDFRRGIAPGAPSRPILLAARGALAMACGHFSDSYADLLTAGRSGTPEHAAHPALSRWRSLAALALWRSLATTAGEDPRLTRQWASVLNMVPPESEPPRPTLLETGNRWQLAVALASAEQAEALRWGVPMAVGWAMSVNAIVTGRERAVDLLLEAIELLDVAGAPVELAIVRFMFGNMLAASDRPAAAHDQYERAHTMAVQAGSTVLAEQLSALRAAHATAKPEALTRQELKIARLALAGQSNKLIAAGLSVHVRTVELHLSNVYRKLRIPGRRGLVAAELDLD